MDQDRPRLSLVRCKQVRCDVFPGCDLEHKHTDFPTPTGSWLMLCCKRLLLTFPES